MVLLYLQNAFDTVDQNILLMELETMCLYQGVVRWFRSYMYLADRLQLVDVSGKCLNKVWCFIRDYFGIPFIFNILNDTPNVTDRVFAIFSKLCKTLNQNFRVVRKIYETGLRSKIMRVNLF